MRTSGRVEADAGSHAAPLEALREGLRFVFGTPIMVWTTGLDFFATFFAGSLSLLPIFADQVLHVGPAGYGWLVSAPALGALVGSFYTSFRHLPPRQGRLLLASVAFYGVATVVYGLSRSYWLTFLALALSGLADLVSTVIRQTLRQLLTPDALRGRMTSVNMIFFMGGPQLGELEAGLVASLFASAAVGATVVRGLGRDRDRAPRRGRGGGGARRARVRAADGAARGLTGSKRNPIAGSQPPAYASRQTRGPFALVTHQEEAVKITRCLTVAILVLLPFLLAAATLSAAAERCSLSPAGTWTIKVDFNFILDPHEAERDREVLPAEPAELHGRRTDDLAARDRPRPPQCRRHPGGLHG